MDWMHKMVKKLTSIGLEEIMRSLLWPGIITGVGILIGWLQKFPLFHIYLGSIFLLAMSATWLVRFSDWKEKNRVGYKLRYHRGITRLMLSKETQKLSSISLGLEILNAAMFPVKFEIVSFQTKIVNMKTGSAYYPPRKEFQKNRFEVSPNSCAFFHDHPIDIGSPDEGNFISTVEVVISYGRGDKLDHSLEVKKYSYFDVGKFGIAGGVDWYDA